VIRLAQLSDLHFVAEPGGLTLGKDTAETLASVIEAFPLRPDVAVVTGDITHDGSAEACVRAASMTSKLGCEVYYVAGNHDDPDAMGRILDAGEELRMVALSDGWTIALVCSRWAGHDAGLVDEETHARLEEALARTNDRVVVCIHHPPISTCSNLDCSLTNAYELMEVLRRGDRVRAVLSGHLHQPFDLSDNGMQLLGAPSTFEQIEHGGASHFKSSDDPPAARLVELHDNGEVTSRLIAGSKPGSAFLAGS
jgi:Icc protein